MKEISNNRYAGVDDPIGTKNSTNTTGRYLETVTITGNSNTTLPLVFYGTAFAFVMLILCNLLWCLIFAICVKRDEGYVEYRK